MELTKMKNIIKPIILLFLLAINTSVNAGFSMYENCILNLLQTSCVTTLDAKASYFIKEQGKASCFVGDKILEDIKFPGPNSFKKIIIKNNFKKNDVSEIISETLKCVENPDELKKCSLVLTHKEIIKNNNNVCKYFTTTPILNLIETEHGIKSNAYNFQLPKNWKIYDIKIKKDGYKFTFKNNENEMLLLEISSPLDKKQYLLVKNKMKDGIPSMFPINGMELVEHSAVDLGLNKQTDEIVSFNAKTKFALTQHYIYGSDRIAALTMGRYAKHEDLIKDAKRFVGQFEWKTP